MIQPIKQLGKGCLFIIQFSWGKMHPFSLFCNVYHHRAPSIIDVNLFAWYARVPQLVPGFSPFAPEKHRFDISPNNYLLLRNIFWDLTRQLFAPENFLWDLTEQLFAPEKHFFEIWPCTNNAMIAHHSTGNIHQIEIAVIFGIVRLMVVEKLLKMVYLCVPVR